MEWVTLFAIPLIIFIILILVRFLELLYFDTMLILVTLFLF